MTVQAGQEDLEGAVLLQDVNWLLLGDCRPQFTVRSLKILYRLYSVHTDLLLSLLYPQCRHDLRHSNSNNNSSNSSTVCQVYQ